MERGGEYKGFGVDFANSYGQDVMKVHEPGFGNDDSENPG
jgi:hypothetical protein